MRSPARLVAGRWLLVALVAASAWASALDVVGQPEVTGSSGEYVTLGFRLKGEGEYTYAVNAPEGWEPLSRSGRVKLGGDGFVSVTVKVPRSAPALSVASIEILFTNTVDPSDTALGRGSVTVAAFVGLALIAPTDLVGELGEPMELSVVVTNRGNMHDVARLSADGGMWDVRFESQDVPLEPGEQREVAVVMIPTGSVTPGYRHVLRVTAVSTNDPTVTARAFTESVFIDSALATTSGARQDPRLVLSVRSGVTAGVTFDETGATPSLRYDVNPRLSGELSDYVDVTAGVGSFAGSIVDPFEEVPSRFDAGLSAETWDAATSISAGSYALSGGGLVRDWRLGGGATYLEREDGALFGVTASAVSQVPGLDLQFVGRTTASHGSRSDTIGGRYRTPLSESLLLTVGTDLIGSAADGVYRVTVGVSESLTYQAQAFDVTQSYSGVPQAGVHNLGVSGGLRSAGPFGVRASTS
ncbi:MAG TPA: hypothetical protein VFN03_07985, partial [Trueperaceae bacterium]|nr:hypothetical protein [Trueperaceae bacterium]